MAAAWADEPVVVRYAHVIQVAAASLLGLGVLLVPSAGMRLGHAAAPPPAGFVAGIDHLLRMLPDALSHKHLVFAGLSVAVMLLASVLPWERLMQVEPAARGLGLRLCNPLPWAVGLSLVLVGVTLVPGLAPGLAKSVNGSSRWLTLGPITFQPSELLKWSMIPALAWWCHRRGPAIGRFWTGLVPAAAFVALCAGMVMIEDLGTGCLMAAVSGLVLLAGGVRVWHVLAPLPLAVAGVVAAVVAEPYRLRRLTAFLDPWADPAGAGYHPIASMAAFASGGLYGRGLGRSTQKYHLPEDTTDFVFPILCEELGLAGGALVVGLFLVIFWFGLSLIHASGSLFGRLVGLGVLCTVGLQACINLAVVTVTVPTKGIALPLISAGGTGWVLTSLMLGWVASLEPTVPVEQSTEPSSVPGPPPTPGASIESLDPRVGRVPA